MRSTYAGLIGMRQTLSFFLLIRLFILIRNSSKMQIRAALQPVLDECFYYDNFVSKQIKEFVGAKLADDKDEK